MDGQAMNPTIRTIRGAEQVEKQLEEFEAKTK
jgi:iron complex transport system substrate-binding protein